MKNLGIRKVLVNIGFLNPELEKDIYICKKMGGENEERTKKYLKGTGNEF